MQRLTETVDFQWRAAHLDFRVYRGLGRIRIEGCGLLDFMLRVDDVRFRVPSWEHVKVL